MKKFVLEVYQIFNASLELESEESTAFYKVVNQDGVPCVQAKIDHAKRQFVLRFDKQE